MPVQASHGRANPTRGREPIALAHPGHRRIPVTGAFRSQAAGIIAFAEYCPGGRQWQLRRIVLSTHIRMIPPGLHTSLPYGN